MSRKISHEAQDVFFDLHTVFVANLDAKLSASPSLRHVEFRGGAPPRLWPTPILPARSPKLKTVVLAREGLPTNGDLRRYLQCHEPNIRLHCLQLGLWKLEKDQDLECEVMFKNFELKDYLTEAKVVASKTPLVHIRCQVDDTLEVSAGDEEGIRWCVVSRLALWLASYAAFSSHDLHQLHPLEERIVAEWCERFRSRPSSSQWTHKGLPKGVKLEDVSVAEHGQDVVEWAAELIGEHLHNLIRETHEQFKIMGT